MRGNVWVAKRNSKKRMETAEVGGKKIHNGE